MKLTVRRRPFYRSISKFLIASILLQTSGAWASVPKPTAESPAVEWLGHDQMSRGGSPAATAPSLVERAVSRVDHYRRALRDQAVEVVARAAREPAS